MVKKLSILYFVVVSFLTLLVFSIPVHVHAEPAHCFIGELDGSAPFHSVECSQIAAVIPGGPQNDQCYYEVGWPPPQTRPFSSTDCQKWIQDAQATSAVPAKCVAIDGSMADWNDGKIQDLTKYNINAKCSDFFGKLTTNNGGDQSFFQAGTCYLIFKAKDAGKYDATFYECSHGLQALVAHQQVANTSQVVPNATREQVIHCGEKDGKSPPDCLKANPLIETISNIVDFVSAGIGVIVVIMIIVGGIQYVTAGNNPQAVSAAKKRIYNALIALVAFILLFAFMNWLIPGGVL
jgi:hypothetical protein